MVPTLRRRRPPAWPRPARATRRTPSSKARAPDAHERGVLAEAVAGHGAGSTPTPLDRVEHDQAEHEGRQLASCGWPSARRRRRARRRCGDVTPGRVGRLVDQLPRRMVEPGRPHAGLLRALAGERERDHGCLGLRAGGAGRWPMGVGSPSDLPRPAEVSVACVTPRREVRSAGRRVAGHGRGPGPARRSPRRRRRRAPAATEVDARPAAGAGGSTTSGACSVP